MLAELDNGLRQTAIAFICDEIVRLNPETVRPDEATDIAADLHLDSVAMMDLVFAMEEKFDVSLSMNALADITKVGQLADLVCASRTAS